MRNIDWEGILFSGLFVTAILFAAVIVIGLVLVSGLGFSEPFLSMLNNMLP